MLRAVLFDLDDTLIDQASAAAGAVVAWAKEHGITDPDVTNRWARVSETQYARYARRELTFAQMRRERVRGFLAVEVDDYRADEIFAGYLDRYEAGWVAFDDAVPTLRRARAVGLKVGVLTNGDEDQQRYKLDRLGLTNEIDVLIASSILPAGKPDRRAFTHAIEHLGVDAAEALMVGNSLDQDVLGALAVGLSAVLLDRDDVHVTVRVPRIRSLHELDFSRPRPTTQGVSS